MDNLNSEVKVCNKCGLTKHIDEFGLTRSSINGKTYRRHSCKSCTNKTGAAKPKKDTIVFSKANTINYMLEQPTPKPKPNPLNQFTDDEVVIIKKLIKQYNTQTKKPTIKELINLVINNENGKINKTYSMNIEIIEKVKQYSKDHGINKSNLVNLALEYFFTYNTL